MDAWNGTPHQTKPHEGLRGVSLQLVHQAAGLPALMFDLTAFDASEIAGLLRNACFLIFHCTKYIRMDF
ncbi:hypothetical protein J7E73_11420 [Paenibacillus albidus]|uniref:hypothetical protein n=1 Tax=Paenibacillus albidus TaxID=2041023 RepID=UPI001BE70BAC|nr:hypothetical protein [Paenibacillus albidus]MBT2289735.1 hypothetical protein [Paenibacillus albidus]